MQAEHVTSVVNNEDRQSTSSINKVYPDIYQELRKIAVSQRRAWRGNDTINTTALIHEAYLKLAPSSCRYKNRKHFYASATRAMRQVLVNYAERSRAEKRSAVALESDVDSISQPQDVSIDDLLFIDSLLKKAENVNSRQCRIVEFRIFGGMSIEETANLLEVSVSTVKREWLLVSAWLYRELRRQRYEDTK